MARTPQKKVPDSVVIRLNSLGKSLESIGDITGCHPTTISLRLRGLGIPPTNTRRAFMDEVLKPLPPSTLEWLADKMTDRYTIKDLLRDLIVQEHERHQSHERPAQ